MIHYLCLYYIATVKETNQMYNATKMYVENNFTKIAIIPVIAHIL